MTSGRTITRDTGLIHYLPVGLATPIFFTMFAGDFWRNLIGWWGFGVLAVLLLVAAIAAAIAIRPKIAWHRGPKTVALFLLLAIVSLGWSAYPGATALGVVAQLATTVGAVFAGYCLTETQLLRCLGVALRAVIGLSLLFELVVSVFVRHPILPLWVDYGGEHVPEPFYWSRGLLFQGGQIQGIVGNNNLLGMCALLAIIVFGIQLADRTVHRGRGMAWLAAAALTFVLTRSSTVIFATAIVAIALLFALWARRVHSLRRAKVYWAGGTVFVVSVVLMWMFWEQLLELLGKSDDLTGRLAIWESVVGLIAQAPIAGWGWVSYWAPWTEPFKGLAVSGGVTYLQAHNAWLDVTLQLGLIGLVVFVLLVGSTLWRSWFMAIDVPTAGLQPYRALAAVDLLPLLVITALIGQSVAESRILVESGWLLLVTLSIRTKLSPTRREHIE